jgi:hypothetical protein
VCGGFLSFIIYSTLALVLLSNAVIEILGKPAASVGPALHDPCKKTDFGKLQLTCPALAPPPPRGAPQPATMPSILRERNPLSTLTDPKPDIAPGERDIRMNDYVNDKIQTAADLEDLESLIASVEIQHKLLEEQVSNAPQSFYVCA